MMSAPSGEGDLSCGCANVRELFHSFCDKEKIAVAVSGGSDSLALLLMLADWANEQGKYLHCLTVDHGLRAASGDEAVMVGAHCFDLGISHDVLRWDGEKPTTGLSNAARDARYELMARRCLDLGIADLVLGHQRDDQAETLLMRLSRSDQGGRGLAGMPQKTEYWTGTDQKITMHRPLLDCSRLDLQSFLSTRNVNWVSDPTNDNEAYERVRVRSALQHHEMFREQLLSYGKVSAGYRTAMSLMVAKFVTEQVETIRFGGLSINKAQLHGLPEPVAILALQSLLSVVGGRDYLPSVSDVQRVLARVGGQTLARVRIHDEGDKIYLTREVRHLPSAQKLSEKPVRWDKRFFVQTSISNAELVSGYELDADGINQFVEEGQKPLSKIEKIAFQSAPFLLNGQQREIKSVLCLEKSESKTVRVQPLYGGFQRFCGAFDLPIRRALTHLLTK
ncbi:MAG: tRNA lysidine(34) synthetase TilS [Hyphomicrobiales bacterium]